MDKSGKFFIIFYKIDVFDPHGLKLLQVTVRQRDVCQNGFELDKIANAVFLDLPHPWEAIPHAKKSLKQGNDSLNDILCQTDSQWARKIKKSPV